MHAPQAVLFKQIHAKLLKPQGFRKATSARSERSIAALHQAVVCVSSRFNSAANVDFTVEFRIGHEAFFHLHQPGKPFPGLTEKFMPLLSWRPREVTTGNEIWWNLSGDQYLQVVEDQVLEVVRTQGLPMLELMRSPEGIVEFCAKGSDWFYFLPSSWALYHMGQIEQAYKVIDDAIERAPHENARQVACKWRSRIGG